MGAGLTSKNMKTTSKTEKKQYSFQSAPRCGARNKSNHGEPCKCPAMRGKKRCRVHGGAKGSGAPKGNTNALRHGAYTFDVKLFKHMTREMIQQSKRLIKMSDE
jgi:uncharacterized protein YjcR